MDIHNYKRRFERLIERVEISKEISKANKKVILDFKNHLLSEGIGLAKIARYMEELIKFDKMLKKDFSDATKEDIKSVIAELNQSDLKEWTKYGFKATVRRLYIFIEGIEERGVYPERVKWISLRMKNCSKKLPEELLTESEFKEMIRCCDNIRDKTLMSCLSESGCRVGEIGSMKIKHVSFENHGTRLTVKGKTGMRKVLVINSTPYLQEWINTHPKNNDPEAYLWYNPQKQDFLSYTRIVCIIKKAAKRAGIKKRIHAHLFRHSRATQLAIMGMNQPQLNSYLGWIQGSKMSGVYIHMSGKDTDNFLLEANGVKVREELKEPQLKPKECIKCKAINSVTNRFCKTCGFILDEKETQEVIKKEIEKEGINQLLTVLFKDESFIKGLAQKLESLNKIGQIS